MAQNNFWQEERKIYDFWEKRKLFAAQLPKDKGGKRQRPFVIVQPPPNVTGELHLGHALTATIEDILVRFHKLKGEQTLFLPGVDHAGIATQYVLEKELKKEGKTRFDLGREKFIQRIWQLIEKYGKRIDEQHRRLGVAVDWNRKRFTMDKDYQASVKFAFEKLYKDGLIYKGKRIINWCPRCQTAISDLENIYKERRATLFFLNYGPIEIATTRPETIFADVAVAVNPSDKRYKNIIGQKAKIPLTQHKVPIIADDLVDMKFGTGALKITPAHDELDHQIWEKHKEEIPNFPQIITEGGKLKNKEVPQKYVGMTVNNARSAVALDLKKEGFLVKEQKINHSVGHCQRCNTATEPLISEQWFIKMKQLAEAAVQVVKEGKIKIIPKRFEKNYFNWLENIRDWCISRQIWWGHPIPIEGEDDVLDTWFSSSLWPFATLGWPKETNDYQYFYPMTILETGYDILFFWVARMIMMGLYLTDKEPFEKVVLHGLVRDILGKKMSKTLGNVMDPLELADKYGADALRLGLIIGTSPGNDVRVYEEKIISYRNFVTKVRNIGRFILDLKPRSHKKNLNKLSVDDKEIIGKLEKTIEKVTKDLESFQLHLAASELYQFVWHEFADIYLEKSKVRRSEAQPVLEEILKKSLILLHPFMPFITEEIYQKFEGKKQSIMLEAWPTSNKN